MTDYTSLHQQLILQTKLIFDKYNIDPSFFLETTYGKDSQSCHADILTAITRVAKDSNDICEIEQINYKYIIDMLENTPQCKDNTIYNVGKVLRDYLDLMYSNFFKIKDGKIQLTNSEIFTLPSLSKDEKFANLSKAELLEKDINYINNHSKRSPENREELELLITQDGKVYSTPCTHKTLAGWLNANGIDLHGAIRIEATKRSFNESLFDFNSLYNYAFSQSSNNDELITISSEQANSISSIHNALSFAWRNLQPFENSLRYTTGFGFGKKDMHLDRNVGIKNLNTLYYAIDFDRNSYLSELNQTNNIHQPLQ